MTRTALRIVAAGFTVLVLAIAAAPMAAAQQPYTNVRVSMSPGPTELGPGQVTQIPVTVAFSASNFTCSQQADFTVKLSVSGADEPAAVTAAGGTGGNDTMGSPAAGPALTATIEPSEFNFSYSGLHQDLSSSGAQEHAEDATLTLAGGSIAAGTNATVEVTGTFDQPPQGCTGTQPLPVASDSAAHEVRVFPDPETSDGNLTADFGMGADDNATAGNETDGGGAPGLGPAAAVATVAFVALAMARRRKP